MKKYKLYFVIWLDITDYRDVDPHIYKGENIVLYSTGIFIHKRKDKSGHNVIRLSYKYEVNAEEKRNSDFIDIPMCNILGIYSHEVNVDEDKWKILHNKVKTIRRKRNGKAKVQWENDEDRSKMYDNKG